MVHDMLATSAEGGETRLLTALDYLLGILKKKSLIFIVSDFYDTSEQTGSPDYLHALRILAKRHRVYSVLYEDPLDYSLPVRGLFHLKALEGGQKGVVSFNHWYEKDLLNMHKKYIEKKTSKYSIGKSVVQISRDDNYYTRLSALLAQ